MNMKFKKYVLVSLIGISSLFYISATTGQVDYFEVSKNIDIFVSLFKELNVFYVDKIDPSTVIRKGIDAMLESLDPYTEFYSEAETEDFRAETTGKYGGVGSVISQRGEFVYIEDPYEEMPAYKAGLRIGDKITEIDGKSMKGKATSDVSKLLKGTAGTKVKVTIMRMQADGTEKKMDFEILRQEIKLKSIPYAGMASPNIGYITLNSFTDNAGNEVREELKKLKKDHNLEGIILDLRSNPGGLLHEAVNLSNVFLDQDIEIVSTKGKIAEWNKTYRTQQRAEDNKIPLVILTNGTSASASEIVSGAIQDYDRGVIVGGKTFGKGLVQQTRPLPYNTQLKVTTSKYYIPSGRCIQAINYAEKNPDGSVKKIPDSLKVAFKTKGGRVVYDGGGIDPDIKTKKEYYHDITVALITKGLIAEFANDYVLKNPKPANANQYNFTDADFDKFTKFIQSKKFEYDSDLEKPLKALKAKAEDEKSFEILKSQFEALSQKIKESKNQQLQLNKKDITDLIEGEIIRRYYSRRDQIERGFTHDEDIKEAIKLIKTPAEYQKLLKKL
jgi:carboxyl-terminal processing protease